VHVTRFTAKHLAGGAMLLMAMLWGSTYIVIKDTVTRLPAADMLFVRFTIAAVVLLAAAPMSVRMSRQTLRHGVVLGMLFGAAQLTQTFGLERTSASISGFITGLFVVFTAVLGAVLLRSRLQRPVWLAVLLATAGLGVLSILPGAGSAGFGVGEALTLVSALMYAAHILALGRFATPDNVMSLTVVQSAVLVGLCLLAALPGGVQMPTLRVDWIAILYLATVAGSLTLFLQTWAQSRVEPVHAAVIMCSEPLWAAFFAILLGGELLGWRTVLGGAAIVGAMYLVVRPSVPRRVRLPDHGLVS